MTARFYPLALMTLALAGCSDDERWEMVSRQDVPSPDGRHIATVFEMCSFDTTGDWEELSLRRPGQKLGKFGNLLQGSPADLFTVRWTSPTNLLVEYYTGNLWASYPPPTTNMDGVTVVFVRLGERPRPSHLP